VLAGDAPVNEKCTLGIARYRAGDWNGAAKALSRALQSSSCYGFQPWESDYYRDLNYYHTCARLFIAMTSWRLGEQDSARQLYAQALDWMEQNKEIMAKNLPQGEELRRNRAEAAELLGIKDGNR
jgi:hypothetical protein